jgi:hypothetical protein
MTLSVLCIARVFLHRTILFEVAGARSELLHCVVAVSHVCLFGELACASVQSARLLHSYNDGRAVQLELAPDAARLRSGGRAASKSQNLNGGARPASRDSHAGRPCAASASARGPWPRR